MFLNNQAIQRILYINENSLNIEIKHPGSFTEWCKKQGFDGVTCNCICKGLKSNDTRIKKKAIFAYNFGFKKNNKKCSCAEKNK